MVDKKPHHAKPLSLHPLTVKEAMSAFMAVDPHKVEKRTEGKRFSGIKKKQG